MDTLIQHPASLTHRVVDAAAREAGGISEGMLRVSVGLECPEDLWADLQRALDALPLLDGLVGQGGRLAHGDVALEG